MEVSIFYLFINKKIAMNSDDSMLFTQPSLDILREITNIQLNSTNYSQNFNYLN